jgi:nitroreductase
MANFLYELVKRRKSIRRFTDTVVEQEKIDMLMKTALMAPTSKNSTPWHFILVKDKTMLNKLSESRNHGSQFAGSAALVIVVLADTTLSDVWVEDTSIVSSYIQLQAEELGLGSCWIQVRERIKDDTQTTEEYIRGLLNIPVHLNVLNMIALGYRAGERNPEKEEQMLSEKIHKKNLLMDRIHQEKFKL